MPLIEVNKVEKLAGAEFQKRHLARHKHGPDQFEVLYIKDGEGLFFNGEALRPFSAGSLILVPPETHHQLQPERLEDPLMYYSLILETRDSGIREILHNLTPRYNPMDIGLPWHPFFEEMALRHLNPHPLMSEAGYHRILSLLFELPALEQRSVKREPDEARNQHLTNALEYIEQHLYQSMTLKELCQEIKISEEYLIRLFRRHLQTTPMKHLSDKRISAAKALLEETDLSIKEISWKLKFTDQYHFSRVFKKTTGKTPSDFRNNREMTPSSMRSHKLLLKK
jgi:AraC-like DNA-binding protein